MADPRQVGPQMRRSNYSPLMQALSKKGPGEVINFCPFGCQDYEIDENGYCAHLIGFYNGGNTYEPRVRRKQDRRVITSGKARKPMERGYKLVQITTTARVYSPAPVEGLAVKRDDNEARMDQIMEEERRLLEAADRVRNPILEGEWGDSGYSLDAAPAAAATAHA